MDEELELNENIYTGFTLEDAFSIPVRFLDPMGSNRVLEIVGVEVVSGSVEARAFDGGVPNYFDDDRLVVVVNGEVANPGPEAVIEVRARDAEGNVGTGTVRLTVDPPELPEAPIGPLVVTTAEDSIDAADGELSLREAVLIANQRGGEDTVLFAEGLDEVVLGRELRSADDLVIDGDVNDGGASGVTIRSEVQERAGSVFADNDVAAYGSKLRLEDLTLERREAGGSTSSTYIGIEGRGADVELTRAGIVGGNSGYNYGISAQGGSIVLDEAFVTGARGVVNNTGLSASFADVRLERSEVSDLIAFQGDATGVRSRDGGRVEVTDSEVTGILGTNFSDRTVGVAAEGELVIVGSTVEARSNNDFATAVSAGGRLEATNSTFVVVGPGRSGAGAVEVEGGAEATLTNATLSAFDQGPRVELPALLLQDGADAEIANSVLLGPVDGGATSLGGNVFTTEPGFATASDTVGADRADLFSAFGYRGELLLSDNGGPTPTAALRPFPDNPAIGRAVPELAPEVDQRGVERDDAPDAGAFEVVIADEPDPEGFEVTTAFDLVAEDGELSLREAVARANATAGEDTITFAEGLSQVVVEGEGFEVTDALVVDGGGTGRVGQGGVTLTHADGQDSDVTLFGTDGARFALEALQVRNFGALLESSGADVRLNNIYAYSAGVDGAAVVSIDGGALTARDFSVYSIRGDDVAGVRATDATLNFEDVGISGVFGRGSHSLELRDTNLVASSSSFGNTGSPDQSPIVRAYGGSLTLSDGGQIAISSGPALVATGGAEVSLSEVRVNGTASRAGAAGGYDAAVFVEGSLSIDRSLFQRNDPPEGGSVIEVDGTLEMVNTTLTNDYSGPTGSNGVVLTPGSTGTITNSTIASNFGTIDGGFAVVVEDDAELRLENSLIAANGTQDGGPSNDVRGAIESNGGNVFGQAEVEGAAPGDALGADPELIFAEFGRFGLPSPGNVSGPVDVTLDLRPVADNPAIGQAVPEDAPPVDQRGLPRDATPEAGAYEVQVPIRPAPTPNPEAYLVTTGADVVDPEDGLLSLREAVDLANARSGPDTILFDPDLDEVVLERPLVSDDDLTIDGDAGGEGGASSLTIRSEVPRLDPSSGEINVNVIASFRADLSVEDLTLARGTSAADGYTAERGVYAENGALSLERVDVTGGYGPNNIIGVGARAGSLRMVDSTVSDLGGRYGVTGVSSVFSDFFMANSEVSGVRSLNPIAGGRDDRISGVATNGGRVEIVDSVITDVVGNRADTVYGVRSGSPSTFTGNTVEAFGEFGQVGAVLVSQEALIVNSTLLATGRLGSNTDALKLNASGEASVVNSLLSATVTTSRSGTGFEAPAAQLVTGNSVEFANSIIRGQIEVFRLPGELTSQGGNVFTVNPGFARADDVTGADAADIFEELDASDQVVLADNGGPTPTAALRPAFDNPAIGRADPDQAPDVDQRGLPRDDEPDAGPFEVQGEIEPPPPPPEGGVLTVTFLSEEADYDNSLGYYVLGEDGRIAGGGVLFENASDEALEPGDSVTLDLEGVDQEDVGFFLIRDGANVIDFDAGEVSLLFDDVVYDVGNTRFTLQNYQVQFDFEPGQLIVEEGEGGALLQFWEDKASFEGSYDGDFDDAVFEVRFETGGDEALV